MALLALRFDFRNPDFVGVPMAERYEVALEMARWADGIGFDRLVLSEHHGEPDGFVSSPLTLAAAAAARTERIRIQIAAMVTSFHDPIRLAEDIATVDLLSRGRIEVVLVNGYAEREFTMFDQPMSRRAARTEELVRTLRQAWTGEAFEFRGREVRVTPKPHTPGGPPLILGGDSKPAAHRAARLGDFYMPSHAAPWEFYREECERLGKRDPGPFPGGDTSFFHLTRDPDGDWDRIAPHALHETNAYGKNSPEAEMGYVMVTDADQLRQGGHYRTITPTELLERIEKEGDQAFLVFHPMMGGIPPELGWQSLRLFQQEVLPHLDR